MNTWTRYNTQKHEVKTNSIEKKLELVPFASYNRYSPWFCRKNEIIESSLPYTVAELKFQILTWDIDWDPFILCLIFVKYVKSRILWFAYEVYFLLVWLKSVRALTNK